MGCSDPPTAAARDLSPALAKLEELLPALTGASTGLLVVRAWLMLRLRRRREHGT